MSRATILGAIAVVAALLPTTLVHAEPVADFKFGTTLYVRSATVAMDDTVTASGGIALSKPANTLDFSVAASDIGLSFPITIHLVSTPLGNGQVQYNFNEVFNPGVDIDGQGHLLTNLYGTFLARFKSVPGLQTSIGNVVIDIVPASSTIYATGDWGTETIHVLNASFFGGYLPASLKSYVRSDTAEICSSTTATKVQLSIIINNPAPPSGQIVYLTSAHQAGVALPAQIVIPPGKTYRVIDATIAPNFTGTVHTSAAAGGGLGSLDIAVDPASACQSSGGRGTPVAYNPDPGCINCTIFETINDWGERLGLVNRQAVVIQGTTFTNLASLYTSAGVTTMTARSLSNSGYLTGQASINGVAQAYRANLTAAPGQLDALGAMTAIAVGNYGTVLGYRTLASGQLRAVFSPIGYGILDLPVTSLDAYSSYATAINNNGAIVGSYTTSATGASRGFRYSPAGLVALPTTAGQPVAISDAGQIAANGVDAAGAPVATFVLATNEVITVAPPAGYTSFRITGMNSQGWVVGTATNASGVTRGYVWVYGKGFTALTGITRTSPAVIDAVAITDARQVVAHQTTAGVTNLFVIPL